MWEGSGCGSVGRAVTSDTRDLRFEYSFGQNFIMKIFTVNCCKEESRYKVGT